MLTLTLASVGTPAYAAAGPAPEPDDDGASGFDEAEADAELEPSPAEEKAARQIVGGVVMASLGLILGVTAFGLVGARATCELEGDAECAKNMRIAALSTGLPGLGLMAGGGALLGIGLKKRKALAASGTARLHPLLLPGGGGGGITVRF